MAEPLRNVRPRPVPQGLSPLRHIERVLLRNGFLNAVARGTAKAVLTAAIWPRFFAPYRWKLTRYEMPLAAHGGLDGYKILHLTDFHTGRTKLSYLFGVIECSLAEKPDVVVITGDLIDYSRQGLEELPAVLAALSRVAPGIPDGILATLGNHDYHEYSYRHNGKRSARRHIHRQMVAMVEASAVRLLRNQAVRISRGGGELIFVGLDEMWADQADAAAAFASLTVRDAVVCLQHNPDGIEFLETYPWQYMLCGHSHGGQANFPGLGPLYVPMNHREYLKGFFRFPLLPGQPAGLRERTMFVSRGIGHTTPIRMCCPPEVTLFTVRAVE
jgi:uncharacterized protein